MRQGTTPTHIFTLSVNPSTLKTVLITYAQDGKIIVEKTLDDCEVSGNTISVTLTQTDTLAIRATGYVQVQVRAITEDGEALTSNIMRAVMEPALNQEVLS